ncbi:MAG: hypothetical protein Q8R98_13795, partial [Rubrivivax sp.]|nr:hypothetical protein [Rubrivivax sp.]
MSTIPCTRVCSAAALALATLLGGCGTYVSTLDVRDNSAPIVTARALHRLGGPIGGGGGLEAEVHAVRATDRQNFTDTDAATLNGRTILGPTTLHHRVSAQHVQLVYNHLLFPGRPIEMEWFAGATVSRLQWDTNSTRPSDPQLTYRRTWYGPVAGLVGRVPLAPGLALEGRFSGAIEFRRIFGGSRT